MRGVDENMIDLRQVSSRLNTSRRTLRTWVIDARHSMPAYRIGGKLLFRWSEVEAWIERHRVAPVVLEGLVEDCLDQVKEDNSDAGT